MLEAGAIRSAGPIGPLGVTTYFFAKIVNNGAVMLGSKIFIGDDIGIERDRHGERM
jgi:hypothetical protein